MTVRTKDKVFLAVLVPVALVAAFLWFERMPTSKRLGALRAEQARLPDADLFPSERRQLEGRLAEAEKALAAARAEKPAELAVKGDAGTTMAARQDAALAAFTAKGARIVRVEPAASGRDATREMSRGGAVLEGTGIRPVPEARTFVMEAAYGAFVGALRCFSAAKAPVVPEGVSLTVEGKKCRWEVTLWL